MSEIKVRVDTDYKVTAQQIARLERGLLSLRESSKASPEATDAIASIQYQEILQLRAELDAAMGFAEEPCDLTVSLSGPAVGIGTAPTKAIADILSNLRAALQGVTAYLVTGKLPSSGRFPNSVTRLSEFQFVGVTAGSVRLKLNLPDSLEHHSEGARQPAKYGLKLLLETVRWIASSEGIEKLEAKIDDERLLRLLLDQARRIAPKPNGPVRRIGFASRLVESNDRCVLSYKSIGRIEEIYPHRYADDSF